MSDGELMAAVSEASAANTRPRMGFRFAMLVQWMHQHAACRFQFPETRAPASLDDAEMVGGEYVVVVRESACPAGEREVREFHPV